MNPHELPGPDRDEPNEAMAHSEHEHPGPDRGAWMGSMGQVLDYLTAQEADQDDAGAFLLVGPEGDAPVSFMGATGRDSDVIVKSTLCFLVDGERRSLAPGLAADPNTDGLGPVVIF